MNSESQTPKVAMGLAGRMAHAFIDSKLTPLVVITSVLLGVAAILLLPREEEPQIKVPMIDVLVAMPGFSAKEVGERATRPMEKLLWEIPGVEYTYSTSRPGESLAIVRFKVGEDVEKSLVKLNQKLQSNFDHIPQGVSQPLIKLRSIDDVPILALTFHSAHHDHLTLRRLVAQVDDAVKQVPLVAETTIIGGARRQLRVLFDPLRLASRQLSVPESITRNTRRMAGMMEEILALSRLEAGKLQFQPAALDLSAFCRRVLDEVLSATNRRCKIELVLGSMPEQAQADERLLNHIFTNLLSNAVKYSEPGSAVHFAVGRDGPDAVCTIRDQGIGIPEDDQQYMFKAFHRGSNVGTRPGTGLGLLLVKRCADLHGGKVTLNSKEGEGTAVTVRLHLFERNHEENTRH